jgi:hypothetical protein
MEGGVEVIKTPYRKIRSLPRSKICTTYWIKFNFKYAKYEKNVKEHL